ncbi:MULTISPECIES: GTPase HflX [unclassified Fusibacter]|uniref:GTPase HflX n=1 Tax=unclassified Fusibacter TaxID=2624464 RepID=UPI001013AA47|nr:MULTISPECIES: GTPase HflX [unclassified Fusibacter]MCK8061273.1 GTPase HflX [Fusibacter sp. A2]NPE23529.1 GTPase HflX [Fusibacter sp. A1]RXV59133.1 GTPase HflX [Fusibacter sp. A1]
MNQIKESELVIEEKQVAILVGLDRGIRGEIAIEESMQELAELTSAAGAEVAMTIVQNKQTIEAATYIGKGKVEEVRLAVVTEDANLVIFNDELSGAQIRNLEEMLGVRVIDRTALILDIFALRAQSKIAKLQVELAQHKYRLPRLKGLGSTMSKTGGGIGTRGPGEQKLEIDRRRVNDKITDIRRRLQEAADNRGVTRQQRKKNEVPIVALVGYTNAGKSSVMNAFLKKFNAEAEDKQVFEKDMLFATLDTYHRKIDLDDHKSFILIDTVGFVSKLPHALVEAFKATLEEVIEADLLVHVVDASNTNYELQMDVTDKTLKEVGMKEHNELVIFNKADLLEGERLYPRADIWTSMLTGEGFEELIQEIDKRIFTSHRRVKMLIPYTEGSVLNRIISNAKVFETTYEEEGTLIDVEIDAKDFEKFESYRTE